MVAVEVRDEWQSSLGWLTSALSWVLDPDVIVFGGLTSLLLRSDTTALGRSLRKHGPAGVSETWRLSAAEPGDSIRGAIELSQRAFFAIPSLHPAGRSLAHDAEVAS